MGPTDVASPSDRGVDMGRVRPGDAARLAEIVAALSRHGLVGARRRGQRLLLAPRRVGPDVAAVALRRSFVGLGPTFVKLGQVIASSPGLFPDRLSLEFRRLLDDVRPVPWREIRHQVERDLGRPLGEAFARFDPRPVAAASIAQVHDATLHDGTRVAVKIRRPRLRRGIEQDLRLLGLLARALENAPGPVDLVNPVAIVDDLADTLRAELDFRREATDMRDFAANLGDRHPAVVVPEPVFDLSTERVLTMTFVDGTSVDDTATLQAAGHDLVALLRAGLRAWLEAAFVHGLFHGDVHAGNLFVTADGKVAFLDFGIMGRLSDEIRSTLRAALPALALSQDARAVVDLLVALGGATGSVDVEAAAADVERLVEPHLAKPLGEISYPEILSLVLDIGRRHHLRLPAEMVLVVKQLLYLERYSKEIAPDYIPLADLEVLSVLLQ